MFRKRATEKGVLENKLEREMVAASHMMLDEDHSGRRNRHAKVLRQVSLEWSGPVRSTMGRGTGRR